MNGILLPLLLIVVVIQHCNPENIQCSSNTCSCSNPPSNDECVLDCSSTECYGPTLNCANDYPCNIDCTGDSGGNTCRDVQINCDNATECSITCGSDHCRSAHIDCGSSHCSLNCAGCPSTTVTITPNTQSYSCSGTNCPSTTPFTVTPSLSPTIPSLSPSNNPSRTPTKQPTQQPTNNPSASPSHTPTSPSNTPSKSPTSNPTVPPSRSPSKSPTASPSSNPSKAPIRDPTQHPSRDPTAGPMHSTGSPSKSPTDSLVPSQSPISSAFSPTGFPSAAPTVSSFEPTSSLVTTPRPTVFQSTLPSIVAFSSTQSSTRNSEGNVAESTADSNGPQTTPLDAEDPASSSISSQDLSFIIVLAVVIGLCFIAAVVVILKTRRKGSNKEEFKAMDFAMERGPFHDQKHDANATPRSMLSVPSSSNIPPSDRGAARPSGSSLLCTNAVLELNEVGSMEGVQDAHVLTADNHDDFEDDLDNIENIEMDAEHMAATPGGRDFGEGAAMETPSGDDHLGLVAEDEFIVQGDEEEEEDGAQRQPMSTMSQPAVLQTDDVDDDDDVLHDQEALGEMNAMMITAMDLNEHDIVWNDYIERHGDEPPNATQFYQFSKVETNTESLTYLQAKEVFDANQGKGRVVQSVPKPDNPLTENENDNDEIDNHLEDFLETLQ